MSKASMTYKDKVWPKGKIIRNILVRNVDVGQLPTAKAEAFFGRSISEPGWQSVVEQLMEQGIAVVHFATREQGSTLEVLPLDLVPSEDDEIEEIEFEIVPEELKSNKRVEKIKYEFGKKDGWVSDIEAIGGVEVEVEED